MQKITKLIMRSHAALSSGLFVILSLAGLNNRAIAQATVTGKPLVPAILPGKGAAEFDFFYAGEGKSRNMYIIRDGKIAWSYIDTAGHGEISDAVLMTNGNILFAHQFGITLIGPDKKVLWNYDTPPGCETHTAQPIGTDHVVFIQNGDSPKLFVMNIKTGKTEKEFALPVKNPNNVHGQFRHARLTKAGTIIVAHMDLGKVCEYDINGNQLLSLDVPGVWSAVPLKNGNILVSGNMRFVREITPKGDVVWEYPLDEIPGFTLSSPQIAIRLANGNTIVNNWYNQWQGKFDMAKAEAQAIEVTPGKKVVWALYAWAGPLTLGPSTTIQVLNDANSTSENVHFGNIK